VLAAVPFAEVGAEDEVEEGATTEGDDVLGGVKTASFSVRVLGSLSGEGSTFCFLAGAAEAAAVDVVVFVEMEVVGAAVVEWEEGLTSAAAMACFSMVEVPTF